MRNQRVKNTMNNIDGEISVKKEGGHNRSMAIGTKNNSLDGGIKQ